MGCQGCMCGKANQSCILKVPIFNQLSAEEMQEIAKKSMQRTYQKGEFIFRAGERTQHLFIIHKGRVKIYRLSSTGREQLMRVLGPGDFVGELALFSRIDSPSYAEVLEETEICLFLKQDINDLLLKYPSISIKILEEVSTRLNETEMLMEEINAVDVERRVATYLVNLVAKKEEDPLSHPVKIILPMSKTDLASFIGTSRETLSRKLSGFQQRGWIKQTKQRTITILSYNELQNRAEGINSHVA